MAQKSYNNLYTGITSTIKNNSLKQISGITLQGVLIDIVDSTFGAFSGNTSSSAQSITGITSTIVSGGTTGTTVVLTKILDIGPWDMTAVEGAVDIGHGLSDFTKIKSITAYVYNDTSSALYDLNRDGFIYTAANTITLNVNNGGFFDDLIFNSTTINRGWVHLTYIK